MAISITWATKVINVPKADLLLIQAVPTEIRQLNLDTFRLTLKDLEDDSDGMAFERTHLHNTSVTVGGVVLARVIEIINGYTVTFEDGQYAVNLVGANSNVGDVVNVNQVSVRSSNSAGLQDLSTLLSAAYQGKVIIDVIAGQAGTDVPLGTFSTPVSNTADALIIAQANGLRILEYINTATILEDLSAGYELTAISPLVAVIGGTGSDLTNCSAKNVTLAGELHGLVSITRCGLLAVDEISGVIDNSFFSNTVILTGDAYVFQCFSQLAGLGMVNIHTGTFDLVVRDFHGSITISNMTSGVHSIGIEGGELTLDATCTGGTVYLREEAFNIIDNSNGTALIDQTSGVKIHEMHGQIERSIYVDQTLIATGDGSQKAPFNSLSTSIDELERLGLFSLVVMADIVLDRNVKNLTLKGIGLPTIDLNGKDVTNSTFDRCSLEGVFIGNIIADECIMLNNSFLNGFYSRCAFSSMSTCIDTAVVTLVDSLSAVAGLGRPSISMNAAGTCKLGIRSQRGGLNILDCNSATDEASIEMMAGSVTLESTCTDGTIILRGVGSEVDNSNGSTVISEMVQTKKLLTFPQFIGLK